MTTDKSNYSKAGNILAFSLALLWAIYPGAFDSLSWHNVSPEQFSRASLLFLGLVLGQTTLLFVPLWKSTADSRIQALHCGAGLAFSCLTIGLPVGFLIGVLSAYNQLPKLFAPPAILALLTLLLAAWRGQNIFFFLGFLISPLMLFIVGWLGQPDPGYPFLCLLFTYFAQSMLVATTSRQHNLLCLKFFKIFFGLSALTALLEIIWNGRL